MKYLKKTNWIKAVLSFFLILNLIGCTEYFTDPLVDKETGEEINLLILDFNFFSTRMSFKLKDATDGSTIYAPARVTFTGQNGDDIVTFAGQKNQEYFTSEGQLELTTDPSVTISANSPFDFVATIEIEGYNSISKGLEISSEGIKTFELLLSKIENEEQTQLNGNVDFGNGDTTFHFSLKPDFLKSAEVFDKPFTIGFSTSITSLKKFKDAGGNLLFNSSQEVINAYNSDPANFLKASLSTFSHYASEIDKVNFDGMVRNALFQKLETGKLISLTIAGTVVANLNGGEISANCKYNGNNTPDVFGFANFTNGAWNFTGATVMYQTLDVKYTIAKASGDLLCERGSIITFKSNVDASFSIDADVFDLEGNFITSMNFKGNFPETFTVENVPSKAVKLVFRTNNPSFNTIAPLQIENFCSGSYDVNVAAANSYIEYQITLKAICPDNVQVAIAPTYSGEVRLKNSSNLWQGVTMNGGVVDLLGLPEKEYELRLMWNGKWEYSSYETKFDANGNYLGSPHEDAKIKSKKLDDGRIQINVEKIFEQNICDDLGW